MDYSTKLVSAELLGRLGDLDKIKVTFETGTVAYIFSSFAEVQQMVGEYVIVDFRQDVVDGEIAYVCTTLTTKVVVATVDSEKSVKLYSEEAGSTLSSVSFDDLDEGTEYAAVVLFCESAEIKTSQKAKWAEFLVLDKNRVANKMRWFYPDIADSEITNYNRKYVIAPITVNAYGIRAEYVQIKEGLSIASNPDFALAEAYCNRVIEESGDTDLRDYLAKSNLLRIIGEYTDPENIAESGYLIQQLAIQLGLAQEMRNLSKVVDYSFLLRLIVFDKLYVLTNNNANQMELAIQSVVNLAQAGPKMYNRKMILALTDSKTKMFERVLLDSFKDISKVSSLSHYITNVFPASYKIWR